MFLLRLVFTDASRIYDCCRSVAGYHIQIEIIVIYHVYLVQNLKIPQARVMVFNIYIRYTRISLSECDHENTKTCVVYTLAANLQY